MSCYLGMLCLGFLIFNCNLHAPHPLTLREKITILLLHLIQVNNNFLSVGNANKEINVSALFPDCIHLNQAKIAIVVVFHTIIIVI